MAEDSGPLPASPASEVPAGVLDDEQPEAPHVRTRVHAANPQRFESMGSPPGSSSPSRKPSREGPLEQREARSSCPFEARNGPQKGAENRVLNRALPGARDEPGLTPGRDLAVAPVWSQAKGPV